MHCWLTILAYPCNSSEEPILSSHQQNYIKKKPFKDFPHVIEMKITLLSLSELVKFFKWKKLKGFLLDWQLLLLKSTGVPEVPCQICQCLVNDWYPMGSLTLRDRLCMFTITLLDYVIKACLHMNKWTQGDNGRWRSPNNTLPCLFPDPSQENYQPQKPRGAQRCNVRWQPELNKWGPFQDCPGLIVTFLGTETELGKGNNLGDLESNKHAKIEGEGDKRGWWHTKIQYTCLLCSWSADFHPVSLFLGEGISIQYTCVCMGIWAQQQVWDLRSQGIYGVTPGVSVWVPDWVHAPYASDWRDRSGLNQVPDTGMKPRSWGPMCPCCQQLVHVQYRWVYAC